MRAVIWTDVIQFALYLTGSLAAFLLLLHKIPGGWSEVRHVAAISGGKLTIFDFAFNLTKSYTFWAGILGGTFLTMASHGTDQTLVQRLLAARNERDSKTALLASGVIVFVQFALFLVIGVMLFVFAQHQGLQNPGSDPDRLYPQFVVQNLPTGLTGLVLASIFAIAMSNASGSLNSLASSSIIDLGKRGMDLGTQPVRRSRIMTIVWGIVLALLGLIHWGPVLVAGLTITSITYGAMLGVFLLGMWNRRANETGALVGFIAGLAFMLGVARFTPLAWTWYVFVGTIATFCVGTVASLADDSATRSA